MQLLSELHWSMHLSYVLSLNFAIPKRHTVVGKDIGS